MLHVASEVPQIHIILLNWNQTDLTLACLRSLACLEYSNFQIILVDNGSKPGSFDQIKAEFPQITLICLERNRGFTGGNNAGIARALGDGADYVMLLNNDTEVAPDLLQRLVDYAEARPRCGIVGPLIYYYDEPRRIWSAGGAVDPCSAASTSLREGKLDDRSEQPVQVDYISGCALLIKRSVVEQVGLLDDRFFIYYEETDWCARVRELGYEIWLVPQGHVWHKIAFGAREASPRYEYLMTRNRLLYLKKRGASFARIAWVIVSQDARTLLSWSLRPRHRAKRVLRRYRVRGIMDYMRGRFGEPLISIIQPPGMP